MTDSISARLRNNNPNEEDLHDAADIIDAQDAKIADLHRLLILSSDENCRMETDIANLLVDASIAAAKIAALVEALVSALELVRDHVSETPYTINVIAKGQNALSVAKETT